VDPAGVWIFSDHECCYFSPASVKVGMDSRYNCPLLLWRKVATFMIRKDPNSSKIHRLRVIHLYDADLSLLLGVKWRSLTQQLPPQPRTIRRLNQSSMHNSIERLRQNICGIQCSLAIHKSDRTKGTSPESDGMRMRVSFLQRINGYESVKKAGNDYGGK
jgi:hypothetical protein